MKIEKTLEIIALQSKKIFELEDKIFELEEKTKNSDYWFCQYFQLKQELKKLKTTSGEETSKSITPSLIEEAI